MNSPTSWRNEISVFTLKNKHNISSRERETTMGRINDSRISQRKISAQLANIRHWNDCNDCRYIQNPWYHLPNVLFTIFRCFRVYYFDPNLFPFTIMLATSGPVLLIFLLYLVELIFMIKNGLFRPQKNILKKTNDNNLLPNYNQ